MGEEDVPCELNGYGLLLVQVSVLYVGQQSADNSPDAYAVVLVERVVLYCHHCVFEVLRHVLDVHHDPVLSHEPGNYLTVDVVDYGRKVRDYLQVFDARSVSEVLGQYGGSHAHSDQEDHQTCYQKAKEDLFGLRFHTIVPP